MHHVELTFANILCDSRVKSRYTHDLHLNLSFELSYSEGEIHSPRSESVSNVLFIWQWKTLGAICVLFLEHFWLICCAHVTLSRFVCLYTSMLLLTLMLEKSDANSVIALLTIWRFYWIDKVKWMQFSHNVGYNIQYFCYLLNIYRIIPV